MADSPITMVQGGGTLAQTVLASAPEGMLIAPAWKRVAAFMLDVVLISVVLSFATGGRLMAALFDVNLLTADLRTGAFFVLNWFVSCLPFISISSTQAKRSEGHLLSADSESLSFMITGRYSNNTIGVHGPWPN